MKCRYCGHDIPEGELYCGNCGEEVFVIPDYSPLDDMLTAHIKVGMNTGENVRGDSPARRDTGRRNTAGRSTAGKTGRNTTGRNTAGRNTGRGAADDREKRRRQAERRKELLRRKRRRLLLILMLFVIAIGVTVFFLYRGSYTGTVKRGYGALESREYEKAAGLFTQAMRQKPEKTEAYTGLSEVYLAQGDSEGAEGVFADAAAGQPENAGIYEAYIDFYLKTAQEMRIPILLDEARDSVREKLSDYIVEVPEFDLSDEEVFEDVQQVSISAEAGTVCYTTDGSDPTTDSPQFSAPVQLGEGENIIKAIAVDKKGIPSLTVEKHYIVEFPIEDAPAVSPSTGQYDSAQKIEIKVPDGYEAYYTMDGSDPTTASTRYTGPVDMPEGSTLFKAILVNGGGRQSGVTTRNYMLDTE